MPLTVKHTAAELIKTLETELPGRINRAASYLGSVIASRAAQEVAMRIPTTPPAFRIYHHAIKAFVSSDGKEFAVAGQSAAVPPTVIDANLDVVFFDSSNDIDKVMRRYNPWTTDAIPPIQGGYQSAGVVVRRAGEAAVARTRARLRPLLPTVTKALRAAGATGIGAFGSFVFVNGQFYTDIVFLAKQLELGLGGFPRHPHWTPVARAVAANGALWATSPVAVAAVERILDGQTYAIPLPQMSAAQVARFSDIRASS